MSCPEGYKLTSDKTNCEIIKQPGNTWWNKNDQTYYSNTPKGYTYDEGTAQYYKNNSGVSRICSDTTRTYDDTNGKCTKSTDFTRRERVGNYSKPCPSGTQPYDTQSCYIPDSIPNAVCPANTTYITKSRKCYSSEQIQPLGVYPKYKPIPITVSAPVRTQVSKATFGAMNGSGFNWLVILLVLIIVIIAIRWYIKKQSKVPALTQFGRMVRSIRKM
jgi:hypothetical protein